MNSVRFRLLGHIIAYGSAGLFAKAAALIALPILTRTLSAEDYGLADLASSLAAALTLLARFGGEIPAARMSALVREPASHRRILGVYVGTTALVSIAVTIVLTPLVGLIAGIWQAPGEPWLAVLALILVPIGTIQLVLVSVVRLEGRAYVTAFLATVDLIAQMAFAVILVIAGFGAYGVIVGYILGSLVGAFAAAVVAMPHLDINFEWKPAAKLVSRGLPYLPVYIAFVFADQIARLITVGTLGPESVGHLALAFRVAGLVALAAAAFSLAWGPVGLGYVRSPETVALFGQVVLAYTTLSWAVCVIVGALAPEIVMLISGSDYLPAAMTIPTLIWSAALAGTFFVFTTAAGITDRGWLVAGAAIGGAVVQVIASAALASPLGIGGIGVAAMTGRLVGLLLIWIGVRDVVPLRALKLIGVIIGGCGLSLLLQATIPSDPSWTLLRWTIASLGTGGLAVMIWRYWISAVGRPRTGPPATGTSDA